MVRTNVSIGNMIHDTENYPLDLPKRSGFDRSHWLLTAIDAGYIVPVYQDFMYPGETIDLKMAMLCRLGAQIVPFMYNVYLDFHLWAIPVRLIWDHWSAFIMNDRTADNEDTDYLTPQLTTPEGGVPFNSIHDMLGVRPGISGVSFNSFFHRAYNLCYNEWYRDENLQNDPVPFITADTGDSVDDYVLLRRGKRKDRITGALPFTQKGQSVDLPIIQSSAPVYISQGATIDDNAGVSRLMLRTDNGYLAALDQDNYLGLSTSGQVRIAGRNSWAGLGSAPLNLAMVADLSDISGTILQFYQSLAVQSVLQKDARGGTRYIEGILNHFGVRSSDARLQRPEFIGGGTFDLDLTVVPQTSSSDGISPQGNLSSYGEFRGTTKRMIYTSEEYMILLGVVSIRAPYIYQYGMDPNFFRRERFDFYLPALDNIGEQAIYNRELFVTGTDTDSEVYGYNEAWIDLRTKLNRVTGLMRSDAPSSLDFWHLGEKYNTVPKLNSDFIVEKPPIDRVLATQKTETDIEGIISSTPQFICNFSFKEYWYRPMHKYSIPGIQGVRV